MELNWLFFTVLLFWVVAVQQVKYWAMISALGYKSATPLLFIQKDYLYFFFCWSLFGVLLILTFFQTLVIPWIAIVFVLAVNQLINFYSRKRGCAKYREIVREMIGYGVSQGEDVSTLRKELDISESELLQRARDLRLWEK